MNTGIRLGLSAIVAVAAAWAGAEVYLGSIVHRDQRGISVPAGEASISDHDSAVDDVMAMAGATRKVPDRIPEFTLADLNGRSTSISRWRGHSLMINFWATWCPPCRREVPLLENLHLQQGADGAEVLGIAVDRSDAVHRFASELKITYPLLIGEQDALNAAAAFGVESPAFPFTVFTDRQGQIVALFLGELKRPQADAILSVVEELNAKRIELPAARNEVAKRLASVTPHI